jgi:hypothetical protein
MRMTLADQLLEKLADWKPTGDGRHSATFALPEAGWTATLTGDTFDTLGCRLDALELNRNAPATVATSGRNLTSHAKAVATRATGLLEPLALIEVDQAADQALLRSREPARKGGDLHYYEARFEGLDRVSVRRFKGSMATPKRTAVPFALTHEAIAKLADDLTRE